MLTEARKVRAAQQAERQRVADGQQVRLSDSDNSTSCSTHAYADTTYLCSDYADSSSSWTNYNQLSCSGHFNSSSTVN